MPMRPFVSDCPDSALGLAEEDLDRFDWRGCYPVLRDGICVGVARTDSPYTECLAGLSTNDRGCRWSECRQAYLLPDSR
jgi:hypothetical protein